MAFTFTSKIVGVTYRNTDGVNRQDLLPKVKSNDEVYLVPDPTNPYDGNAVKVIEAKHGWVLGYLPREVSQWVSAALREGRTYRSWVKFIMGGGPGKFYGAVIEAVENQPRVRIPPSNYGPEPDDYDITDIPDNEADAWGWDPLWGND